MLRYAQRNGLQTSPHQSEEPKLSLSRAPVRTPVGRGRPVGRTSPAPPPPSLQITPSLPPPPTGAIAAKIKDGVFLGSSESAQDLAFVLANKISHIINCAGHQVANRFASLGVKYLTYRWADSDITVVLDSKDKNLNEICNFIKDAMDQGESVLIHSLYGISRSCCVVIAYLMRQYAWELGRALDYLRGKRPDMCLKPAFLRQLKILEKRLQTDGEVQGGSGPSTEEEVHECVVLENTYQNSFSHMEAAMAAQGTQRGEPTPCVRLSWIDSPRAAGAAGRSGPGMKLVRPIRPPGKDYHSVPFMPDDPCDTFRSDTSESGNDSDLDLDDFYPRRYRRLLSKVPLDNPTPPPPPKGCLRTGPSAPTPKPATPPSASQSSSRERVYSTSSGAQAAQVNPAANASHAPDPGLGAYDRCAAPSVTTHLLGAAAATTANGHSEVHRDDRARMSWMEGEAGALAARALRANPGAAPSVQQRLNLSHLPQPGASNAAPVDDRSDVIEEMSISSDQSRKSSGDHDGSARGPPSQPPAPGPPPPSRSARSYPDAAGADVPPSSNAVWSRPEQSGAVVDSSDDDDDPDSSNHHDMSGSLRSTFPRTESGRLAGIPNMINSSLPVEHPSAMLGRAMLIGVSPSKQRKTKKKKLALNTAQIKPDARGSAVSPRRNANTTPRSASRNGRAAGEASTQPPSPYAQYPSSSSAANASASVPASPMSLAFSRRPMPASVPWPGNSSGPILGPMQYPVGSSFAPQGPSAGPPLGAGTQASGSSRRPSSPAGRPPSPGSAPNTRPPSPGGAANRAASASMSSSAMARNTSAPTLARPPSPHVINSARSDSPTRSQSAPTLMSSAAGPVRGRMASWVHPAMAAAAAAASAGIPPNAQPQALLMMSGSRGPSGAGASGRVAAAYGPAPVSLVRAPSPATAGSHSRKNSSPARVHSHRASSPVWRL